MKQNIERARIFRQAVMITPPGILRLRMLQKLLGIYEGIEVDGIHLPL